MLCAHLQDDPEKYLRTAKFNRGNMHVVRNYVSAMLKCLVDYVQLYQDLGPHRRDSKHEGQLKK